MAYPTPWTVLAYHATSSDWGWIEQMFTLLRLLVRVLSEVELGCE